MKEKELIWMQSNIQIEFLSPDPVTDGAKKILKFMITEPKNPFKKSEEPLNKIKSLTVCIFSADNSAFI